MTRNFTWNWLYPLLRRELKTIFETYKVHIFNIWLSKKNSDILIIECNIKQVTLNMLHKLESYVTYKQQGNKTLVYFMLPPGAVDACEASSLHEYYLLHEPDCSVESYAWHTLNKTEKSKTIAVNLLNEMYGTSLAKDEFPGYNPPLSCSQKQEYY